MNRENGVGIFVLAIALLFLLCTFMCVVDVGNRLFSKRTEATVTKVAHYEYRKVNKRDSVVGHGTRVSYRFVEPDGTVREGTDELPFLVGYQRGSFISVEYTAGDLGSSRIA